MKKFYFIFIILILIPNLTFAQYILSEIEQIGFIATSRGIYASKVNPAGLAIAKSDDGFLFNYNTDKNRDFPEYNYLFSTGNIGFSYQKNETVFNNEDYKLEIFQIALSVGNERISLGNSTKWVKTEFQGDTKETPNSDIGLMLRPIGNISIAGMIHNISEEEIIKDFQNKRHYSAGFSILLFQNKLVFNSEGKWKESTKNLDDGILKAGITFYPTEKFNFVFGWQKKQEEDRHFWGGAFLNIGGISFGATARSLEGEEISRISGYFRATLESVQF